MIFFKNLKAIRTTRNLTQQQMAERLNISVRTYQNYEQGKREPSLTLLCKIADILDTTTDILLGRVNS